MLFSFYPILVSFIAEPIFLPFSPLLWVAFGQAAQQSARMSRAHQTFLTNCASLPFDIIIAHTQRGGAEGDRASRRKGPKRETGKVGKGSGSRGGWARGIQEE